MSTPNPAPDNTDVASTGIGDSRDLLLSTLSEFTDHIQRRMSAELQTAVEAHAPKFHEIYIKMREAVTKELRGILQQQFQTELQRTLDDVRLRDRAIVDELTRKEAEFETMNRETIAMIEDPDVEISKVIQRNVKQSELQAYIRGLRYSLAKSEKTEKPK